MLPCPMRHSLVVMCKKYISIYVTQNGRNRKRSEFEVPQSKQEGNHVWSLRAAYTWEMQS